MIRSRLHWILIALGTTAVVRIGGALMPETATPGPAAREMAGNFTLTAYAAEPAEEAPVEKEVTALAAADAILAKGCEMPEVLLDTIREERALLDAERERLDRKAAEIALAQEELDLKTAQLSQLADELSGLLERTEQREQADVDRLVALYAAMKPADAARIMEEMDLDVTVAVLGAMAERDAAPILATLTSATARLISKVLLEQSKLPGDQNLAGFKTQ
jgi:flagellar motility protein MotE (MotC chaperone)